MDGKVLASALRRCFRDPTDEEARRTLAPYADTAVAPKLKKGTQRSLQKLAKNATSELATLLESDDSGVRHAAAFVLGYTGDASAVRPLVALLTDQRDWFDHDFAYAALGRLGNVALPVLCRIAKGGDELAAREAVQAMGLSRGDALPFLREVMEERSMVPEGFWVAYQNLGDARGLPEVMGALSDPATRDDALEAAQVLVTRSRARRFSAKKRRRWSETLAPFVGDEDVNHAAQALVCLGWLGDERQLETIAGAVYHEDDDVVAAATNALARLDVPEAHALLIGMLEHRRRVVRVLAAAALEENALVKGKLRKRTHEVLADGVLGLSAGWAPERAFLTLERSRTATRVLLEAVGAAEGRRLARGAEALVQIALFRSRPRAVYERMRAMLRGEPREALDASWSRAVKRERRIQRALDRVRESVPPRS
jgi:HEAT repeat protein